MRVCLDTNILVVATAITREAAVLVTGDLLDIRSQSPILILDPRELRQFCGQAVALAFTVREYEAKPMRAVPSVVGTRGDVQPVIALAIEVRRLGHEVHLCVPPNFIELAQALGFSATSVGIEMRARRGEAGGERAAPQLIPDLIADQFEKIHTAAERGCDVILGANAHQYAARSIAQRRGIRYVNAALPTPHS